MKNLLSLLTLALVSTCSAQGYLNTNKSVSTSLFCKTYKCTLVNQNQQTWVYKTKYGDSIGILRKSSDPSSKIVSAMLMIPNADSQYFPNDSDTFKNLQILLVGKANLSFSESCYSQATILGYFKYGNETRRFTCAMSGNDMWIALGDPGK